MSVCVCVGSYYLLDQVTLIEWIVPGVLGREAKRRRGDFSQLGVDKRSVIAMSSTDHCPPSILRRG